MNPIGTRLKFLFPWVEKKSNENHPVVVTKHVNALGKVTDVVIDCNSMDRLVINCIANDEDFDDSWQSIKRIFGLRAERDFHSKKSSTGKVISYYINS